MRELHENVLLEAVRGWLPRPKPTGRNWQAAGLNGRRWGSVRVISPRGRIVARVKLHRDGSLAATCTEFEWRPGDRSLERDGPTYDLRDPGSLDHIEAWVRSQVAKHSRGPVSPQPDRSQPVPAQVSVANMYTKVQPGAISVDTTSRSGQWSGLSPFFLGPCELYPHQGRLLIAQNVENAWQFSKVYADQADPNGDPTADYWQWARAGWADRKAHRYPKGRGTRPLYSLWDGQRLGYIDARKQIYAPLYAQAVQLGAAWRALLDLYHTVPHLVLRDYDGYDHQGQTLTQVLNNPKRKMGHSFVLKMLLTQDPALQQCVMRL